MRKLWVAVLCSVTLVFFTGTLSYATGGSKKPSAVLVMLSAQQNRKRAMEKGGNTRYLEILESDMHSAIEATIKDFKDHFHFCPVYYFIDTNLDAIREHRFAGVLLDTNLTPVAGQPIPVDKRDYIITYFGLSKWQTSELRHDTMAMQQWGGQPNGSTLVVLDHKLRQQTYVYDINGFWSKLFGSKKRRKYGFESKKFDIEYSPLAGGLQVKLEDSQQYSWLVHLGED